MFVDVNESILYKRDSNIESLDTTSIKDGFSNLVEIGECSEWWH